LRSGGLVHGWGFGVHARTELEIPLPPAARRFRARAGLDASAGRGGCARALVLLRGPGADRILFQSPVLVGSASVTETGWLDLGGAEGREAASDRRLVLVADPVADGGPSGSDPLDIRDALDWLEPLLELDPRELRAEVRLRLPRLVPAWQGWEVEGAGGAAVLLENRFSERPAGWWLAASPALPFLKLSRTFDLEGGPGTLSLAERRDPGKPAARIRVAAGGRTLGDFDVPEGPRSGGLAPVRVPLAAAPGSRRLTVELYQVGWGAGVEWRSAALERGRADPGRTP
ncbi:MAG: hypothetical protein HY721_29455, partial [Planctomycetes bacterium]|nr:hypothetical protein [Planctomycetota bacterium]